MFICKGLFHKVIIAKTLGPYWDTLRLKNSPESGNLLYAHKEFGLQLRFVVTPMTVDFNVRKNRFKTTVLQFTSHGLSGFFYFIVRSDVFVVGVLFKRNAFLFQSQIACWRLVKFYAGKYTVIRFIDPDN